MDNQEDLIVLTGEEAIHKFLAGKAAWNAYVEQYPEADVDFSGVDFSKYRKADNEELNFAEYRFPKKGYVFFSKATFGEGDVNFTGVTFGEGIVAFDDATFGKGNVHFNNTAFGKGNVHFNNTAFGEGDVAFKDATFGEGDVYFNEATFGKGDVYFSYTAFGEGNISFSNTAFGKGDISFINATFGEGVVYFNEATFGKGEVGFSGVTFGEGIVYFSDTTFGEGNVTFSDTTFGEGIVYFRGATFGEGDVSFTRSRISGHADFSELKEASTITSLSFRHCVFNKSLDLSGNSFHCVPELTNTKLSHQVSLDGLTCRSQLENKGELDPKDGDRLCRLKEIAETNKNHEQALNFHIQEMRVKRHKLSFINRIIDTGFDFFSDYGRSVIKPFFWLTLSWFFCGFIYSTVSVLYPLKFRLEHFYGDGFLYATAQIVPFVAAGRVTATDSAATLFGENVPNWVLGVSLSQGFFSFLLIFLIGLALRNRFRI